MRFFNKLQLENAWMFFETNSALVVLPRLRKANHDLTTTYVNISFGNYFFLAISFFFYCSFDFAVRDTAWLLHKYAF